MALKIVLKSGERLLMGTSSLLVPSHDYVTLIIEGDIPVMKEHEAITLDEADSPARQLYYHVQQLYLSGDDAHAEKAERLAESFCKYDASSPDARELLKLLKGGALYKAVKAARRIMRLFEPEATNA